MNLCILSHRVGLAAVAALFVSAAAPAEELAQGTWPRGPVDTLQQAPADGTVSVQVHSFQTMPTSPGSAWIEDPRKNDPGLRAAPDDGLRARQTPFDER